MLYDPVNIFSYVGMLSKVEHVLSKKDKVSCSQTHIAA